MPARIANRDAARYCRELIPFTGSNLRGEWNYDRSRFEIVSYWTLVAFYDVDTDRSWVTPARYSKSTDRQLSYVRQGLPRIVSNAPEAIDGIGPRCRVEVETADYGPCLGYVREVYPLSRRVVVEVNSWSQTAEVAPVENVRLV